MDIQVKRGLLDVCVLAAIKNEDSYGYKIIKDMKPYIELSESTLYTILKRLSQEIREILKNFQAPPPASKQPDIPYGKCVMSHFGNIDVLTKFEPLKMQIFHCP